MWTIGTATIAALEDLSQEQEGLILEQEDQRLALAERNPVHAPTAALATIAKDRAAILEAAATQRPAAALVVAHRAVASAAVPQAAVRAALRVTVHRPAAAQAVQAAEDISVEAVQAAAVADMPEVADNLQSSKIRTSAFIIR